MSDTVERIKEKLSIVDVVSPYVKITRSGKYWKGLSPFTKEKTASFFVSPDRGLYHCFSTGKGGDMFTFIEEMEGVDFKGALKLLAEKAGVPLVYDAGASDERERLYKALDSAKEFFVTMKNANTAIDSYLKSRGLIEKTIEEWGIGYAPDEWRALHDALVQQGLPEPILEKAGLVKKPDTEDGKSAEGKKMYDRFRGRVMFPIKDVSARIVGFSGRILKEDPAHPAAKYLNSPETPVFDKSRALYGIDVAREGIRALGAAILVEGQLDILMAHQAGYKNTIATSGTAFTPSHTELIKRYTPNLLIAYDGDRAGIAAAGRAAAIALQAGMNVKVAKFPAGQDPAELLLKSPEVFKAAIKDAEHVVDFYIAHIKDAKYDERRFRLEVSRTVLPYVAMIPNKIDQAHFIKRVAEAISVPEEAVKAELTKALRAGQAPGAEAPAGAAEPFLSRTDTIERLVFGLMLLFREKGDTESAVQAEKTLKDAVGIDRLKELEAENDETRAALFEADFFLARHEEGKVVESLTEVYADLLRESRHEKYREALSGLRLAEKTGDSEAAEKMMVELSRLASELH